MKYLGLRKYIVNVCSFIDALFNIALVAFFYNGALAMR